MKNCLLFCSTLLVAAPHKMAGEPAGPGTNAVVVTAALVERLVEETRTNLPALRAADLRADAAVWNAASVRTWEDPQTLFGIQAADRSMRAQEGDLIYGLEQKLPLFGKPRAARELAQAEAMTQRHEAAFRTEQLRRDLHRQLLKVALDERILELSRDDLAALDLITAATEDKYRRGLATQVEVLQAQNEKARRGNALHTDESLLRAGQSSLNRLLNRPPDSSWPRLALPAPLAVLPAPEEMAQHATQTAPQLGVGRAALRQAESAVALARKRGLPDVKVGVEARQYSDNGAFRQGFFNVTVSLPWGNRSRYAADLRREQARAEAAQYEIADMELSLRDETIRLSIQIENAQRESALYRGDIIPRTEQALAGAHANWLNNRGTLRDLLEARRMLIEARNIEARAVTEQHVMLADLLLHCGLGDLHELAQPTPKQSGVKEENAP